MTPGANTPRRRRGPTHGRPLRSMRVGNSCDAGAWSLKRDKEKLTPWQDGARASPRVLVLGAYAALRVRGGALEIEHGPHDDRQTIRIDIDAEPKPRAILFDSHGEFMTGEAIRWCARYSINLALPGGPGRLITMVESALETKTNTMTRMRDIDPSIIRAQCAADPVKIAREIVRAKIGAELKATIPDADGAQARIRGMGHQIEFCSKRRRNHDCRKPGRCVLLADIPRRRIAGAKEWQSAALVAALCPEE